MRILVLTPLVPYPPHDGDKLRLYYFLKYLKNRGHQVDLFCLTRVKKDLEQVSQLKPFCRSIDVEHMSSLDLFFNLIGGFLTGSSLNVASYFSPLLREKLKTYWALTEGKKVDVVLAHRLRMAPAALRNNPGKPVVIDLTDSLTLYAGKLKKQSGAPFLRRLAAGWDHWFLRKDEVGWSQKARGAIVIAQPDLEALVGYGLEKDKITVIPNGVDLHSTLRVTQKMYPIKKKVVCFVGNMGYAPNEEGALWFIQKVWPLIHREVPGAILAIVGGTPRKVLRRYHNGEDLLVTGWVAQVEPYLTQASVSIAPLRWAGGMQNKVALSMGLGIPVVATSSATAWMPENARRWVQVADEVDDFAHQVVEILKRPRKAKILVAKGQVFVRKNYRWEDSGRKLEIVLKRAMADKNEIAR